MDISKFYPSLLARDKILFSDVLVASIILIGLKGTFKTSGKPCGDRKSIIALCDLCPKIQYLCFSYNKDILINVGTFR